LCGVYGIKNAKVTVFRGLFSLQHRGQEGAGVVISDGNLINAARLRRNYQEADIVISVPDSGNSAALGYSRRSGIPLDYGFIRNHYVGRTFIKASMG